MNAGDIFNEQIEKKAKELLAADFGELYNKFQSTLQFTVRQVSNGCVQSFQHITELITKGSNAITFNELSESIQKHYLTKAIKQNS